MWKGMCWAFDNVVRSKRSLASQRYRGCSNEWLPECTVSRPVVLRTGEIPTSLGNLQGLRELDLSSNRLTGEIIVQTFYTCSNEHAWPTPRTAIPLGPPSEHDKGRGYLTVKKSVGNTVASPMTSIKAVCKG